MLTKTMRRGAILLSLAVVCATLSAAPNSVAVASKVANAGTTADPYTYPSNLATYAACPGTTAAAAGFTDTTSTDVDCIKMFGITQGATATTYDPSGNIPRWQMALFLSRMYTPMGLAAGTTVFTAFTDISGYSTEIQAAINAIAASGITVGTATGVFSPADNVTREQMALFLYRMGNLSKPYNSLTATTRGIWHDTIATDAGTGTYNYSDIATSSFEGMEAIISLYNAGVTGETCSALTGTAACGSTYRPTASITRAEMASMLTAQLNHTNARPAGVSIQSAESFATVGSKTTTISVRNADFTVSSNTLVDEFFQAHSDGTTAVPVTAQTPFNTLGVCVAASVTKTAGTLCTIDSLDKTTNTLGNVAGTSQTAANNTTLNWWGWTGTAGEAYNDGTTATEYKLSAPLGTAAAATQYSTADTTFSVSGSQSGGTVLGYALGNAGAIATGNYSTYAGVTANNGIMTVAGGSRTITAQLKGASFAAGVTVVDGYTLKFADKKVDMLGNINTTNTYVTSSTGTASYTVTCGADNSLLTTGIGNASSSYWESHEVTVTEATAAGTAAGVSRPAAAGAVTFAYSGSGQHNSTINISCDDAVATYTSGAASTTLSTSSNNYPTAVAGALMSVTATAYNQYGVGIAGQTTNFQTVTDGGGAATQALLTTGADGTATLTAIVCTVGKDTVAWNTEATGVTMAAIAASTPTNLIDGTTVYCTTPINQDGVYVTQSTATDQVTLLTQSNAATSAGSFTLTVCNNSQADHGRNPSLTAGLPGAPLCETTAAIDAIAANVAAACVLQLRALTMLDENTTCTITGAVSTITFLPANQGNFTVTLAATGTIIADETVVTYTVTEDGTGDSVLGTATENWEYVDNDAVGNTIIVSNEHEYATAAGAAATNTTYHVMTYDSGDAFMLNGADGDVAATVMGATEAEFEAEMASLTGVATDISGTEREGALTSGVGFWSIGA